MCGIVGYIGKDRGIECVVSGLKSLEYRGYDSAGIAFFDDNVSSVKQVGRVDNLESSIKAKYSDSKASLAIGHTRWATHGTPTVANAHPHHNTDQTIFVVHNGIIENHQDIRKKLESKGYKFTTETDTETIPHLIDYHLKRLKKFSLAFETTIRELRGAFAITCLYSKQPKKLYACRLSSPLVLGIGKKEFFIASDPSAIADYTNEVVYIDDYEMLTISGLKYKIKNFKKATTINRVSELLDFSQQKSKLEGYPNFMLKEIFEAPQTIKLASLGRLLPKSASVKLGGLENIDQQLKHIDRIIIVACGTSYYAGMVGEYLIEELAGIPVEVQLASEFKYRIEPLSRSTAVIAISQSGETADTIAALKKVEDYGILRIGVVNAVGSTIARMTDAGVYCHAGPEMAVASTKAFIAQVMVLSEIAVYLAKSSNRQIKPFVEELNILPKKAEEILNSSKDIKKIAEKYCKYRDFLFIGRGYLYPVALEGALKLKEISYIHAEGYSAGEMKHGPLALIDKNFATLALVPDGPLQEKTISNIQEIRARKGPVIAVATKDSAAKLKGIVNHTLFVPKTLEQTQPIITAIVLQFFAYYCATFLGTNVNRPRNLAKSVTVE